MHPDPHAFSLAKKDRFFREFPRSGMLAATHVRARREVEKVFIKWETFSDIDVDVNALQLRSTLFCWHLSYDIGVAHASQPKTSQAVSMQFFKFSCIDPLKLHLVAGRDGEVCILYVYDFERRATDKLPSARSGHRINRGLLARNRHCTGRHHHPRFGKTRNAAQHI